MELTIPSLDAIQEAARRFVDAIGERRIVAFYGKMGAGKTTFIKAVCQELGIEDIVTSPTFAILNEYSSPTCTVYHFDLYRLRRIEEFFDIGGEDYFASGNLCVVEWPEIIEPILPADAVRVTMEEREDGSRRLSLAL